MEKAAYSLTGAVTALSPISVSYVDRQGLPRTPHGQVYLNAGTFRGPLRNAALRSTIALIASSRDCDPSEVFNRADMYMLGEGVDLTRGVNNEPANFIDPLAERWLREMNPLLDLFGRWRLPGRLEVSPLFADESAVCLSGEGVRHDMFERDASMIQYLSESEAKSLVEAMAADRDVMAEIDSVRARARELKKQARSAEGAEKDALWKTIRDIEGEEKAIKDRRQGAEESVKHPLSGIESLGAGSILSSRIAMMPASHEQLGLILHALAEFSMEPRLGGYRGRGFGRIAGSWEIGRRLPGEYQPTTIGSIRINDSGFFVEGDVALSAMEVYRDGVGDFDMTVATLAEARKRRES